MTLTLIFELEVVHSAKDYFYLYYTDPTTNELFRFGWSTADPLKQKESNITVSYEEQRQTKEWITNLIARRGFNAYAADNVFPIITNFCKSLEADGLKRGFLPIYRERIGA